MRVEQLKKLDALLDDAKAYRRHKYEDETWGDYESYWHAVALSEDQVTTVPILVGVAQRLLAGLINDVRVTVTATNPKFVAKAAVKEVVLNQLIRDSHLIDQIRDASQDAVTCGTGFIRDGYGSLFGTSIDSPVYGREMQEDDDDNRIEFNDLVKPDMPWGLRGHPINLALPPGTVDLDNAYGFFYEYVRPLEDVKRDEKLMKKHRTRITANTAYDYKGIDIARENPQHTRAELDLVRLVDFYDLRNSHRVTYSPGYRYALQDETDEILLRCNRLPLHAVIFNKNSRNFWGTSDFHLCLRLAEDINDAVTMQSILGRLQVAKLIVDRELLEGDDEKNAEKIIAKLTSDIPLSVILADVPVGKSIRDFVHQFAPSQVYDMMPRIQFAKRLIEEYFGIGENQKGQMQPGRHTKYEAQIAEQHHDRGMQPRRRVLRNVLLAVIENWSQMIYDFWTEPQTVEVRDAAGRLVNVEYTGADLKGKYRYDINIETMRAKSKDEKIGEANMILQQCMPFVKMANPQTQMPVIDPQALIRQYLSHLDTDWDIEALTGQAGRGQRPPIPFEQYEKNFQQQAANRPPGLGQLINRMPSMSPGNRPVPPPGGQRQMPQGQAQQRRPMPQQQRQGGPPLRLAR